MFHRAHNGRKFERPAQGAEQIRYQHVSKAFGGKSVFEDLSLSVAEGETLTVIGGSGAGKSVLLKCLVGLMYPDDGQVIFEGQVVSDFDEAEFIEVRRRIAMVFQGSASKAPDGQPSRNRVDDARRLVRRNAPAGRLGSGDRRRSGGDPVG